MTRVWPAHRLTASAALFIGIAALATPPPWARDHTITWDTTLAPYSQGAPLPGGLRIAEIRRGPWNDVIVAARRDADAAAGVEVHVLRRSHWPAARASRSFSIWYETAHSAAPEREAVTEALAEAIRSHDPGLPSPDAIPLGSDDSSVLPWWLEMLRGGRGLLLGASLALLGVIAIVRSRALAPAGLALGATDLLAVAVGFPPWQQSIGATWTMPAAVLLLCTLPRRRAPAPGSDARVAGVIFALGVTVRLALGAWGPLHVNGMGPLWITGAARDPEAVVAYGRGYVEIFRPIAALASSNPDWAIFALNVVLSAFVPPLAFALGRLAGVSRAGAIAAAFLLAIDPVAIRMAATESYFPAIIVLCAGAAVALLVAAREMDAPGQWRAVGCVCAAGLLLTQAARIHPAAWGLVATVPFVALAGEVRSVSQRLLALLASAAIIGGIVGATGGGDLLDILGRVRGGTLMRPFAPPSLQPLAWAALAAAAYVLLAPRRWLALAAGLSLAGMLASRHLYDQSWIWQQAYDRLYLTLPLVAACGAIPDTLLRRRWVVAPAVLLVAAAWFTFGLPAIGARTTDDLEYHWLRQELGRLPQECRVIHIASAGTRGIFLPTYVGTPPRPAVAIDLRQPQTINDALSPAPCLYYVHTSLCSSAEGRPACAATERRLALAPVARAAFPAIASHQGFPYDSDPVETVIARVDRVEDAAPP